MAKASAEIFWKSFLTYRNSQADMGCLTITLPSPKDETYEDRDASWHRSQEVEERRLEQVRRDYESLFRLRF